MVMSTLRSSTHKTRPGLPKLDIMLLLITVVGIVSIAGLIVESIGVQIPIFDDNRREIITLGFSGLFLAITVAIAWVLAIITSRPFPPLPTPKKHIDLENGLGTGNIGIMKEGLKVNEILMREFEYARETAAQAMEERRTVINFYLLITGGAGSAVVAFLFSSTNRPAFLFGPVILLWVVCLIGWLTLFIMITLRLAWSGSANSMNHIKEFYLDNAEQMGMSRDVLQSAFFFKSKTLPPANRHWNVFHYSAILVALLDAVVFWGETMMLEINMRGVAISVIAIGGGVLAMGFLISHSWIYDVTLMPLTEDDCRHQPTKYFFRKIKAISNS